MTQRRIVVALSGGGHRATVADLGALLALVDRGLNSRVVQISSVSGGSIASAFVGQRCAFNSVGTPEMDQIALDLIGRVRRGVLTTRWSVAYAVSFGVVGAGIFTSMRLLSLPLGLSAVVAGLLAVGFAGLGSGHYIQWLLARHYFNDNARATLSGLGQHDVEHVFCTTDLVLGKPVYFSSSGGGRILRQLDAFSRPKGQVAGEVWSAPGLKLAEVVRSSAAFPGIAPRRLRFGHRGRFSLERTASESRDSAGADDRYAQRLRNTRPISLLGDGGLWNNLGTQVLDYHIYQGRFASNHRQRSDLICVNGSAQLGPSGHWRFQLPVLGLAYSVVRVLGLLNSNTVWPRSEALRREGEHSASPNLDGLLDTRSSKSAVVDLAQSPAAARGFIFASARAPETSIHSGILDASDRTAWFIIDNLAFTTKPVRTTLNALTARETVQLLTHAYVNTVLNSLLIDCPADGSQICALLNNAPRKMAALVGVRLVAPEGTEVSSFLGSDSGDHEKDTLEVIHDLFIRNP